ncbi:MAG: hypothetical protein KF802_04775 [Bdellovibrionaceae bacterium]|nr:hypothetical protein [Pseudobdellovibrionaceae bacterium]
MKAIFGAALLLMLFTTACQESRDLSRDSYDYRDHAEHEHGDAEFPPEFLDPFGCTRANTSQIRVVNEGNGKRERFLARCARETGDSPWCAQLIRPNPQSVSVFRCTYGQNLAHQLIHPDENTWGNAIRAVKIIQQLTQKGLRVCQIYNWWRPEPYNNNVGGAAGRHPFGTSVDVRFCSVDEANKGFSELCRMRKQGLLRAIGHYGSTGLHLGIADSVANTWGRSCPN